MSIIQALLISVITWLFYGFEAWLAYPMLNVPLVLGPVVGLIMGDFTTGVIAGAEIQLVFLGVMQIGGTLPADASLGTVMGTALAIASGGSAVEIATTIAVPVAAIGSTFGFLGYMIRTFFTPVMDKLVEKGDMKGLERLHLAMGFLPELPRCIVLFFCLAFGAGVADKVIAAIPAVVTDGLGVGTGLVMAVGFAILMNVMWNKQLAVYFFLGVLIMAFFPSTPILFIALLGTVIAVITAQREMAAAKAAPAVSTGEEDLFND